VTVKGENKKYVQRSTCKSSGEEIRLEKYKKLKDCIKNGFGKIDF
jgi:hypothetical protein